MLDSVLADQLTALGLGECSHYVSLCSGSPRPGLLAQGSVVTHALLGTQKKGKQTAKKTAKQATKTGKKALSQITSRGRKATSGSSGEWYGPGRPGFLGKAHRLSAPFVHLLFNI